MFNLKKMKRVITFFPCVFFCHSFLVPALTRVIIGSRFVTHFSFCHSFLVPAIYHVDDVFDARLTIKSVARLTTRM